MIGFAKKSKTLKVYIFEIIVIFIGITSSFLFDQWRQDRADREEIKNYLELVIADINDLEDHHSLSNDSMHFHLFNKIKDKSITDKELFYFLNTLDHYIEYSTAAFSISNISKSDIFRKLTDEQDIVAFIELINQMITRHNELRLESDKCVRELFEFSASRTNNFKLSIDQRNNKSVILNYEKKDDGLKELMNNERFQEIILKFESIRMHDRFIRLNIL